MSKPELAISLLWMFLFCYIILASIEFGAGFLLFWARVRKWPHEVEEIIERYLSPFWEVTNVFLIAFIVGLVGFFPPAAYYYGTVLLLPGSLALVLLILKGTFFAYCHYAKVRHWAYYLLQGLAGLLLPMVLVSLIPVSEGGFVTEENGKLALLFDKVMTSPLQWTFVLFALLSVLFVSAVFLNFYANKAGAPVAAGKFRAVALNMGLPALGSGAFILLPLANVRPEHFLSIATDYSWMLLISGALFVMAYGYSHLPYLLYPYLNINDAFVNPVMYRYLMLAMTGGLCMMIPGLIFLAWLFLFSNKYVKNGY